MTAYRIFNHRGQNVVFSFVQLVDSIADAIDVQPAKGFTIEVDANGVPYIMHKATKIPYDISKATELDGGRLVTQKLRVDALGRLERTNQPVIIATVK